MILRRSGLLGLVLLFASAALLQAQSVEQDGAEDRDGFASTFLAATAGSIAGGAAGYYLGRYPFHDVTGCCDFLEHEGLTSGVILGAAGSTAGSSLGVEIARSDDAPGAAIVGSVVGIGTGLLVGEVVGSLAGDSQGLILLGYGVGQGFTAALVRSIW